MRRRLRPLASDIEGLVVVLRLDFGVAEGGQAGCGQKEWLLCESIIDALTLYCARFPNVTCAYGVNGFTAAHWALIEEVKPKRIVNCYDNDPAGNAAAAKLAEEFQARGIVVARAKLPEGKDINDVARLNRDARVALVAAQAACELGDMRMVLPL